MKYNVFILLLIGFGCSSRNQNPPCPEISADTISGSIISPCEHLDWRTDTIFKSTETDFLYGRLLGAGGGFSQKMRLESGYLAIIVDNYTNTDKMIVALFQTDSLGEWRQTYCGLMEGAMNFKTNLCDLNFDGHKDLLIDCNSGGTFGSLAVGFLFDPQNRTFQRYTALHLENMTVDAKNKQLRSRHYTSRYLVPTKWLYGWEGDSLVLLEEALYHADVDATIRLKKRQKNGTLKVEIIEGKMEPLWKYFIDHCVWTGDF